MRMMRMKIIMKNKKEVDNINVGIKREFVELFYLLYVS